MSVKIREQAGAITSGRCAVDLDGAQVGQRHSGPPDRTAERCGTASRAASCVGKRIARKSACGKRKFYSVCQNENGSDTSALPAAHLLKLRLAVTTKAKKPRGKRPLPDKSKNRMETERPA